MDAISGSRQGSRWFWIGSSWLLSLLAVLFAREYYQRNILDPTAMIDLSYLDPRNGFGQWLWSGLALLAVINYLAWLSPLPPVGGRPRLSIPAWLRSALSALIMVLPAAIIFWVRLPDGVVFGYWSAIFFVYCAALFGVAIRSHAGDGWQTLLAHLGMLVLLGGVIFAVSARVALVTAYPFPQYWSEGNRFYDYSTLFGGFRYVTTGGERLEAFITPGLAFPWAVPFVFPALSIQTFRLYYQLVWIIPALLLGYIAGRNKSEVHILTFPVPVFVLWTYIFIETGPVYPPIILVAVLVTLALPRRTWLAAVLVLLAAYYAHISRWTWSYAPGIWSGTLSLLAVPADEIRENWKKALAKPVILGFAGLAGGLLLPALTASPMAGSLINPLPFAERQPLLWDRLLPNATYAPGILLGLLWSAGAALILIVLLMLWNRQRLHWLQVSATIISLAGFLAVGIIASVKIGGGSNLHNLDMFLISIMLVLAALLKKGFLNCDWTKSQRIVLAFCLLVAVASPVTYILRGTHSPSLPQQALVDNALLQVRGWVDKMKDTGEVLFMDQRQLLTFGYIKDVPLVQDYEKKLLMEMAMSRRADYFADFYADIASHRFSLIVNEPSGLYIKDNKEAFSEENNAYVEWVTFPLLCNYYPVVTIKEVGLELLLPRTVLPTGDARCAPFLQY